MVFQPIYLDRRRDGPPARQETGRGPGKAYCYDDDYREAAVFPSDLEVVFRTIRQGDRRMLVMARLPRTSRSARFLVGTTFLCGHEPRCLTEPTAAMPSEEDDT